MKIITTITLFLMSFIGFSQNSIALESVNEGDEYAKLVVTTQNLNLTEGFIIEVSNHDCGIDDSMYLTTPKKYNSADGVGFTKISDTHYIFDTPFSLQDLNSKWFKWRVVTNNETSDWKCFSWSDYCKAFLTSEGKCK